MSELALFSMVVWLGLMCTWYMMAVVLNRLSAILELLNKSQDEPKNRASDGIKTNHRPIRVRGNLIGSGQNNEINERDT